MMTAEAMGTGGNPALVEKHLPKMFTALSRFLVENTSVGANGCDASVADGLHVVGFACQEGERVTMNRPVPMKGRTLHLTLSMIESSMVETLKQLTISAVESLSTVEEVTSEWIMSFPLQVVCLAFQVWWVRLQEKDFASWRSHQQQHQQQPRCECSHDERNPSSAVSRMVLLLDQLASAAASAGEAPALRRANEELATLAVYQRDVSRLMETRGIRSAEEFEWLRVMRLYMVCLDESVELDAGESSAEPVDERSTSLGSKKDRTALYCRMADASLVHGFEYLGWYRRLVQTPLTDRCYLAMTQALHNRLGGSPVGPAGTGKTETVKSLGAQLGRHVVVFNCADAFDYNAIGRILLGLCQVGAWGCFDEFNRLEERVLSAVAQQIRTIQGALRDSSCSITIAQQTVPLKKNVALFVTMNPDFADRSQLPGNLKHLFRTVTMVSPDRETIVEVMLFAQGFRTAEALSRKVVPLFDLCKEQLSRQSHYDFGLRALKSVLVAAGEAKHEDLKNSVDDVQASASSAPVVDNDEHVSGKECDLMLYSLVNSIIPRLVQEDVELFHSLLKDFFPGRTLFDASTGVLRSTIGEVCRETYYTPTPAWVEKICQLQRTSNAKSGLMLVGPSGTGKTSCWKTLLRVMAKLATRKEHSCVDSEKPVYQQSHTGTFEAYAYVIDPKAMTKAELFGVFDPSTREWKDGVFTSVLRRIVKSALECDCSQQKHWIIFDGDVDPQWVENLNSLLDDSKIYTLPNGERLSLPPSVRIVFEAHDLKFATPATVSRCGMVWFSQGTLPLPCLLGRHIEVFFRTPVVDRRGGKRTVGVCDDCEGMQLRLNGSHFAVYKISAAGERDLPESPRESPTPPRDVGSVTYDAGTQSPVANHSGDINEGDRHPPESLPRWGTVSLSHEDQDIFALQTLMATVWSPAFAKGGLLERAFEVIRTERYWGQGIMEHNDLQLLRGVQSLLFDGVWRVWHVREKWGVLPSERVTRSYAEKLLHHAVFWSFGASLSGKLRRKLVEDLGIQLLGYSKDLTLLDVEPEPLHGTWTVIRDKTQPVDLRPEDIGCSDVIIPTADAYRCKTLLEAWITGGDAVILCGPPGSGKTTLVASVLHKSSKYEAVFLNFSSATRPENVIRALEQYCTIQNRMSQGLVMTPTNGKRLLLFCDEINLPAADQYGTQHVVQFLRQLIERSGYYRTHDNVWITLEGVQVIGACNPPTDNGRVSLSHRFLRWAPVLFVEFPTEESLHIIYTAYCRAVLSFDHQFQKKHAKPLAMAMVDVYTAVQAHFSVWQQPQYVFSPRELSQWIRALHGAMQGWSDHHRSSLTVENLVHLVVHEGLRIFHDRLVQDEEREWTIHKIRECLAIRFPDVQQNALRQPKIFSAILDSVYMERTREEVSQYIEGKVRTFCEEEFDAELVVFDTMIDHVIRVDRVLRQPSGHMLLAGASGVGKTVTTRLVAWINNMSIFQINMTKDYQLSDYERDLREVLRRAGCGMERICFIFDDSDAMEPGFLEYINALLPTGEIPGLFDGDKWGKLMDDIRACVETQVLSSRGCATKGFSQHRQWWDENDEVLGTGGSFLTDNSAVKGHRSFSNAMGDLRSNVNYRSITGLEVVAPLTLPDYIDLTSEQQLYRWFVSNVRQNLHVVFVTDPSSKEFSERVVTSPALFNRCTIDWFGEWDRITRNQLASRLLKNVDVMFSCNVELGGTEIESREVLMEALSDIHEATQEVNRVVKLRSAHRGTFITPRHFSSLLQHLRLLYEEKKGKSIEQLTHLRGGLAKLVETSLEVESKQTRLREHEVALAEKTSKAQQILECIISDTGKTEREKREAERLRQQLQDEEELIIADRGKVEQQLSEAAPALKEAEEGLNTIKPEYLREIRAYTTPPVMVKRVLETVLAVMGERRAGEWDVIKLHIRRDDFIAGVKAFQPREISDEAVQMVCGMLNEDGFTYEAAMRASKAAGPLLQWVNAQINYAVVYRAVQPLPLRIEQIVIAQGIKRQHLEQTEGKINALEESLQRYKQDYQLTTEEIANYKATMGTVAARCERACKLLQQLLEERERWEAEVSGFDSEIGALLGDCLLAAASLTYFGYFDEPTRQSLLLPLWRKRLEKSQIRFREKVSADMVDYLVTPSQRLGWELQGLPKDNLYVENAVILHRNRRFPLLIDPTGVATAFLHKMHAGGSMRTTSFTKNGYLKQLDMAIRFGYPLLIEDAEFMDPVVGPLLNNEVRRVGGCVLTRLGGQDIEISPSFRLFLVTRHSNYQPSPGIAGKACIINFTVTQSSLESQCRHQVLLHERAEVDKQRTHVLKMRGEYFLRIRTLEQELLTLIAGSEGSILENSALTVALEQLKEESEVLKRGIVESEESMRAVAAVEAHYQPLSTAVAKVYFVLRRFSQFHGLYQFGVKFIFSVVKDALAMLPPRENHEDVQKKGTTDQGEGEEKYDDDENENAMRLQVLTRYVFNLFYRRARRGMFSQDHLVLATMLGRIRSGIDDSVGRQVTPDEWDLFENALVGPIESAAVHKEGGTHVDAGKSGELPKILAEGRVCLPSSIPVLGELLRLPLFCQVQESLNNPDHAEAWGKYFLSAEPHTEVMPAFARNDYRDSPTDTDIHGDNTTGSNTNAVGPTRCALIAALLLLHTRRDTFVPAAFEFVRRFFDGAGADTCTVDSRAARDAAESEMGATKKYSEGEGVTAGSGESFFTSAVHDLYVIQRELSNSTPLILVANAGSDPTVSLEDVANAMNVQLHVAVMGCADSTEAAEHFLSTAVVDGSWVLLKNMHLARPFADVVEKRLHRDLMRNQLHGNFRLIMSIEAKARQSTHDSSGSVKIDGMQYKGSLLQLPVSLVESSVVVVYEPPPGLKASLTQTFSTFMSLPGQISHSPDVLRIYLAAAWFHAIVMERLRYVPLGWSTRYDISDTEFWHMLQVINSWVASNNNNDNNNNNIKVVTGADDKLLDTSPIVRDRVPWAALQTIIGTALYGGKISNDFDQFLLDSLCEQLFSPDIFDDSKFFAVLGGSTSDERPSFRAINSLREVQAWLTTLPEARSLMWARLPTSASRLMLAEEAVSTFERLAFLRFVGEMEWVDYRLFDDINEHHAESTSLQAPVELQWARKVRQFCSAWRVSLERLDPMEHARAPHPGEVPLLSGGKKLGWHTEDPISVVIFREYTFAVGRLREVMDDLQAVENICCGGSKPTPEQRVLIDCLLRDQVPPPWARSYTSYATTADQWLTDFKSRVAHIVYLCGALQRESYGFTCFDLGLFFWPEAFITTTKQQASRKQNQPLERLQIELQLQTDEEVRAHATKTIGDDDVWHVVGLTLVSASLEECETGDGDSRVNKCVLRTADATALSTPVGALVRWKVADTGVTSRARIPCRTPVSAKYPSPVNSASQDSKVCWIKVPLYASAKRNAILHVVELMVDIEKTPLHTWYEQGICLVAWSMDLH
uniref:Putative dynein heavy chain, cytosolic n=1 Tax=Trypanosoma congolense (strain IL3000) TaxID=1068625 RepID=G0UPW0_TRYCI|nr:putative dynein heavy chain, cytosolic [Trypanosoma congolense IL3000]